MENHDRELILKVLKSNAQLQRLYKEHEDLELSLSGLQGRQFLTPEEELREKQLKLKKLKGVDRMMSIIAPFKSVGEEGVSSAA